HSHHRKEGKDQKTHHPNPPLEPSTTSGLTSNPDEPDTQLENKLTRPKCFDDGQRSKFVSLTRIACPKRFSEPLDVIEGMPHVVWYLTTNPPDAFGIALQVRHSGHLYH
ncbi:MAG: hypothetical protein P8Q36_04025, partial [Alphaproteobacteria bacterium]|nr:hypothetical protein [Alphaproteobacteria bacterium]